MLSIEGVLRYWHTLRHLKPIQFYARIQFLLFGLYGSKACISIDHPKIRQNIALWNSPIEADASLLGPRTFCLLNIKHELPPIGVWNDQSLQKLWLYNLHYFGDLSAKNASARFDWHKNLVTDWITHNPPTDGNGWEPYPLSLRIVNWIKWSLAFKASMESKFHRKFLQNLAMQSRWLVKRLEWHLLGNHLFANAKALIFSGIYFEGDEAQSWLNQGLEIVARELDEQVLEDGGNFERSPMYHAIFLEDLLDLINLAQAYPGCIDLDTVGYWRSVAKKMLIWLKGMTHPDGQISLFNDAAFGVAASCADLDEYALRLGIDRPQNSSGLSIDSVAVNSFKDSGYIRLSSKTAVAFLDVAPIGPDYLPGHAHADTLSFEISLFGQRAIVNGGTSRYGRGPERLRERQTISHSTVEINHQSSSEVWGGFRVARRAYPFDLGVVSDSNQALVSCSHNGYQRLAGKPIHRRTWVMHESGMEIRDAIQGPYELAIARFIFHPSVVVSKVDLNAWQLQLPNGELISFLIGNGSGQIESASYAPEFGKVMKTECLAIRLEKGISSVQMRWN